MNKLFSQILVSSPNGGGLFLINNAQAYKLDSQDTAGLYFSTNTLLRAIQPSSLFFCGNSTVEVDSDPAEIHDVHDAIAFEGSYYLAATTANAVVKFSPDGKELQRWVLPGEKDSKHVNCLGIWNDRIVFSAFGDFSEHRGYKGKTRGAGYVQDLLSGDRLIHGLSQPHSLIEIGKNLLVASSEDREVREYNLDGELIRSVLLEGYPRGICVSEGIIYVGLSRSRNIDDYGVSNATLLALDLNSLEELGRIDLPVREIYSLILIEDTSDLVNALAYASVQTTNAYERRTAELNQKNIQLQQSYDALVENEVALSAKVAELVDENMRALESFQAQQDAHTIKSSQALSEREAELGAKIAELLQQNALAQEVCRDLNDREAKLGAKIAELAMQNTHAQEAWKTLIERESELNTMITDLVRQHTHAQDACQKLIERENNLIAEIEKQKSLSEEKLTFLHNAVHYLQNDIHKLGEQLRRQNDQYQEIIHSKSWKMTKPLRLAGRIARGDWHAVINSLGGKSDGNSSEAKEISSSALKRISIDFRKILHAFRFGIQHYGSFPLLVQKVLRIAKREGIKGISSRADMLLMRHGEAPFKEHSSLVLNLDLYTSTDANHANEGYAPLVSVIVPNYNHAPYLRERLESIYGQTYQNIEVILLDDLSTDESCSILSEFAEIYPKNTRCHFNSANSGGVFHQWKKGLELARGDLVWIAESDDYCSKNFIEENVKSFSNEAVMLSFSRTVFVKGAPAQAVWSSDEYLAEFGADLWQAPFIKSAHWLVNNTWAVKNIVANVSSAMFRNPGSLPLFQDNEWSSMRVCGDWVFYLHLIRGGLVSYSPNCINYYRQHDKNTSVTAQSKDIFYQEHEIVARHLVSLYALADDTLTKLSSSVLHQWQLCRPNDATAKLAKLFNIDRAKRDAPHREPNLLMVVYALAAGGGETFPIMLANLMKQRGYSVTLLNCHEQPTEPGVRSMLQRNIPLLRLKSLELASVVLQDMGIELVHSHHAWVDLTFAALLQHDQSIKQIISMHGMYEMMTKAELATVLPLMDRAIDRVVYTADKNLKPFSTDFQEKKSFVRINNALPIIDIQKIERTSLGIGEDDFVICLVSRAIPEKGWEEAINAVKLAQRQSTRKIHLLLIGEGPEYDRLSNESTETIHFLGFRQNIRDYFSMADIGFLPSRFRGESFPLVLIDCLHAGRPVLASAIGEIPQMLDGGAGLAGSMFELDDWKIPTDQVASIIHDLADPHSHLYSEARKNVGLAAKKFNPDTLYAKYHRVYSDAASTSAQKV